MGVEAVDVEIEPEDLGLVVDVDVVLDENTFIGMRRVPQKDVKLSFLLRTELDMLSFRGRYDGYGCWCEEVNVVEFGDSESGEG